MAVINVHEAKTHLSRLLDRAHAGEEVVISKGGKPYARLVPLQTRSPKRERGTLKDLVRIGEHFFDPLPPDWRGGA